jgi:Fungal N-terminal domain of STAND proteins
MLDPLTAFSVAGTVVQFVDYTSKVFAKSSEIYKSTRGATQINEELQELATDLIDLTTKLSRPLLHEGPPNSPSEEEQRLEQLCIACSKIAADMITRLDNLKPPRTRKRWRSFQQAIKMAWTEDEMNELTVRLSGFKEAIQMHILVGLRYNSSTMWLIYEEARAN